MYNKAVEEGDADLEYLLNLQLFDGFGPEGRYFGAERASPPPNFARFEELWQNPSPEDIFDDDHE